jgi:hypothetical protein
VTAVGEADTFPGGDVEVGLVQQRRRAEGHLAATAMQLPLRYHVQLTVEGGKQLARGGSVPGLGRADELADRHIHGRRLRVGSGDGIGTVRRTYGAPENASKPGGRSWCGLP